MKEIKERLRLLPERYWPHLTTEKAEQQARVYAFWADWQNGKAAQQKKPSTFYESLKAEIDEWLSGVHKDLCLE